MMRQTWIDKGDAVALTRQCVLAGVSRATLYARQKPKLLTEDDQRLNRLIDEEYTRHPFYGSRKIVVYLGRCGHSVNRKREQRLMRTMGLPGMAPGPNTSRAHPQHKVYPYLLREVAVLRPNQVWSTDITYIRLARGFAYLVAIIGWYSRRVLSWRISNSMEAVFCVDCLDEALRAHGKPEVFNSDQGSQFTSEGFTGVLKREGITISMDGRGRAFDNIFVERLWRSVKHEDVYLKGYATMGELLIGLTQYFVFYNGERPHQGWASTLARCNVGKPILVWYAAMAISNPHLLKIPFFCKMGKFTLGIYSAHFIFADILYPIKQLRSSSWCEIGFVFSVFFLSGATVSCPRAKHTSKHCRVEGACGWSAATARVHMG